MIRQYTNLRAISQCERRDNTSKLKDITGERFGRLVVVERVENDSNGQAMWLCQCDCGSEPKVIRGSQYSPDNCRWTTRSVQNYNRRDWSGHRGVYKVTFYKGIFGPYTYWRARISFNGKRKSKSFKTREEAIAQRKEWEKEIPLN